MSKTVKERHQDQADTMSKALNEPHRFFNLHLISNATSIDKDKIYNNFKKEYATLTPAEKKQIATLLMTPCSKMFEILGMKISFSQLPK